VEDFRPTKPLPSLAAASRSISFQAPSTRTAFSGFRSACAMPCAGGTAGGTSVGLQWDRMGLKVRVLDALCWCGAPVGPQPDAPAAAAESQWDRSGTASGQLRTGWGSRQRVPCVCHPTAGTQQCRTRTGVFSVYFISIAHHVGHALLRCNEQPDPPSVVHAARRRVASRARQGSGRRADEEGARFFVQVCHGAAQRRGGVARRVRIHARVRDGACAPPPPPEISIQA
jgi:hypothetical protein